MPYSHAVPFSSLAFEILYWWGKLCVLNASHSQAGGQSVVNKLFFEEP